MLQLLHNDTRFDEEFYDWRAPMAPMAISVAQSYNASSKSSMSGAHRWRPLIQLLHLDVSVEQQFHEWITPMASVAATVAERYALRTTVLRMEGTDGLSPYNSCTMIHASSNSSINRAERRPPLLQLLHIDTPLEQQFHESTDPRTVRRELLKTHAC